MNSLHSARSSMQNNAKNYWVGIQKKRKEWLAANSLQELLTELLNGVSSFYGNCSCSWYQVGSFTPNPELEPVDLELLSHVASENEPSLIDVCLLIAERRMVWSSNQNGMVLEYAFAQHDQGTFVLVRLGDTHFGMDHWIVIELEAKSFVCNDQLIRESFVGTIAGIYLERAHWFRVNRRLSIQFDRAFVNAKHCMVFDFEFRVISFSKKSLSAEVSSLSFVESEVLLDVLKDRLSYWDSNESFRLKNQTRISSFAFRLGRVDIVSLVKYDALSCEWKVILNVDAVQSLRSSKAKRLFTRRQFEAFLHFENGCVDAISLAKRMGISSRTAERYRGIIIHHLENELNVF